MRKNCDVIILNSPQNVGSNSAIVEWYTPATGWSRLLRGTKRAVARRLIELVERLILHR